MGQRRASSSASGSTLLLLTRGVGLKLPLSAFPVARLAPGALRDEWGYYYAGSTPLPVRSLHLFCSCL